MKINARPERYPEAVVGKKYLFYQGEPLEINIFCEEPLIVGEVLRIMEEISTVLV